MVAAWRGPYGFPRAEIVYVLASLTVPGIYRLWIDLHRQCLYLSILI